MKRRDLLAAIGATTISSLIASTIPALSQAPNKVYRLGHIANSPLSESLSREIVLPELAKLGFVEGRNLVFEGRVGGTEALPGLMRELLATKPDAVTAIGAAAVVAAGAATRNVPIIVFGADPVELGLAQAYARPGGNVTGVTILISELEVKRLSILREAMPGRRRLAALVSGTQLAISEPALRNAAARLGAELFLFPVATSADYPAAFAGMKAAGAEALIIGAAPELFRDGKQLAALALEARLPTVCEWAEMAHSGCMMGYGPNRTALRKRTAAQIALIFRGTPPGDIAIELPIQFEFAVNRKIADELGITIPPLMLAQADEVIE